MFDKASVYERSSLFYRSIFDNEKSFMALALDGTDADMMDWTPLALPH